MIFVETRDYGAVDFYWGRKRIKAPEEYQFEVMIDKRTAVFTSVALFFNVFGESPKEAITKMIESCQ